MARETYCHVTKLALLQSEVANPPGVEVITHYGYLAREMGVETRQVGPRAD